MKVHRSLLIVTAGNLICCLTVFFILTIWQAKDENALTFNIAVGWIFWLGMFAFIAPLFLSDSSKQEIYHKTYLPGTILLAVVNVAIPIVSNLIALAIVPTVM